MRAIVAVAQALNLQVIAEGVESAKEDAFLTKNGVNERQGFLFVADARCRIRALAQALSGEEMR